MNVVSEAFEEKLSDKVSEIKCLALENKNLKIKISEAETAVDKINRGREETSKLVDQLKKESTKKENAIKKMKTKKEVLEKSVAEMENLNTELLSKMKSCESKLLELEAKMEKQFKHEQNNNLAKVYKFSQTDAEVEPLHGDGTTRDSTSLASTNKDLPCLASSTARDSTLSANTNKDTTHLDSSHSGTK